MKLSELENEETQTDIIEQCVVDAKNYMKSKKNFDSGICSSKELHDIIEKGNDIDDNYGEFYKLSKES